MRPPLFHVTSYRAMLSIREGGLHPDYSGGMYRAYSFHSVGKVFLAGDPDAARSWFNKIDDVLESGAPDPDAEDADAPDSAEHRVPVMLRVHGRWRAKIQVDAVGDEDVAGSYFVPEGIPAHDLSYWDPRYRRWEPVAHWDAPGARKYGVKRADRDGSIFTKSAHDPGGFKPTKDTQYGPMWKDAPDPKKSHTLKVVWRGNPEATVREILTAFDPDPQRVEGWMRGWWPEPLLLYTKDDLHQRLNLDFLSLKASQYGYKGGVEVVGYPVR